MERMAYGSLSRWEKAERHTLLMIDFEAVRAIFKHAQEQPRGGIDITMKFYMAPMEGLTGYVFRNAYHKYFHDIDKYYTPFLANRGLNHKELCDVLPEHNQGIKVVPQILTNQPGDFLEIARRMEAFGYRSVNLNLGCPSGTVVSKKRGAGFLACPQELERFLDTVFAACPLSISIKTRIGKDTPEEWEKLQALYNRYPVEELTIHPRVQRDYYKNTPNLDVFGKALEDSRFPVCYNGDIHTPEQYRRLVDRFPRLEMVMLGRGILKYPGLAGVLRQPLEENADSPSDSRFQTLQAFHDEILEGYREIMSGDANTLFKMKELWTYLGDSFQSPDKYLKKIRKTSSVSEYRSIVAQLFREAPLKLPGGRSGYIVTAGSCE